MTKRDLASTTIVAIAAVAAGGLGFVAGTYAERSRMPAEYAYLQASIAFAHYKAYEDIEWMLGRKCYEAATVKSRAMKAEQQFLVADNLRGSGTDPELVEYMKLRDPKFVEVILTAPPPELKSFTTTC